MENNAYSLTELAVRASYQVVVADQTSSPDGMGSGAMLYYRNRLFFLTVAHVTDNEDVSVTVETNKTPVNGETPNYCVGGMNYTDVYKVKDLEKLKTDKKFSAENFKLIERLDFAFAELDEAPEIIQRPMDFQHHGKVPLSEKMIIPENALTELPEKNKPLLFYGTITPKLEDRVLTRTPKLTVDGEFIGVHGRFYKIKLPHIIKQKSEFKGTSGAPVFDTKARFIGLISHGFVGSPFIYAFRNTEIKVILDDFIARNPQIQ